MTTGQPCRDGRICDIVTCHDPAPSCEVYGENLEEKIAKAVESRVACQDIFLVVSPLGIHTSICSRVWTCGMHGHRDGEHSCSSVRKSRKWLTILCLATNSLWVGGWHEQSSCGLYH